MFNLIIVIIIMLIMLFLICIVESRIAYSCTNGAFNNPAKFRLLDLSNIQDIRINRCSINDQLTDLFTNVATLPELVNLTLVQADVSVRLFETLGLIRMPKLTRLIIRTKSLNDDCLAALIANLNLENITHLDLGSGSFTIKGFQNLKSANISQLKLIQLNNNVNFRRDSLQLLANLRLPLTALIVQLTSLDDSAAQVLQKFNLQGLEYLWAGHILLTDRFFIKFKTFQLLQLKELGFQALTRVSEVGFKMLFSMKFPVLENLQLLNSELTSRKLMHINGSNMPQLKTLILSNNKLDQSVLMHLFQQFPRLQILRLDKNMLYTLKDFDHLNQQIRQLYLNGNQIQDLQNLCGMANLTILDLADNAITDQGLARLNCSFPTLKALRLNKNYLLNQTFSALSRLKLTNLTELDLSDNKLRKSTSDITLCMPQLRSIKAQNCGLGDYELSLLISNQSNLEYLALKNNQITDVGHARIGALNLSRLRYFDLSRNNVTLAGFFSFNRQLPNLTTLLLSSNQVSSEGALALSQISFPAFKLGNTALAYLSLVQMPNLQRLDIANNVFDNIGLKWLSGANTKQLRSFNTNTNNVTGVGIAQMINANPLLIIVSASMCRISYQLFSNVDLNESSLKLLSISRNFINDQFMVQMRDKAHLFKRLESLMIDNNDLADESLKTLVNIDLPSIRILELSKNCFTNQGKIQFLRSLEFQSLELVKIDAKTIDKRQLDGWNRRFYVD